MRCEIETLLCPFLLQEKMRRRAYLRVKIEEQPYLSLSHRKPIREQSSCFIKSSRLHNICINLKTDFAREGGVDFIYFSKVGESWQRCGVSLMFVAV